MPIYQNNVPFQRQYIGARYVPKFYNGSHGAEWEDNAQYEPLTIVTYLANSYCSKKFVPALAGNPTITPEYWVCISNFNAQVASLEQDIEDVDTKVGDLADLQTTDKRSIVDAINEANASGGSAETKIGNLNDLTTTEKSTVVGAINEVDNDVATAIANIGNLLNLTTEAKNNLVNAVNEVNGSIGTVNNKVGNLSNLNTTEKSNVVGAINEVVGEVGNLSNLETTNKNDLVGAINEANSSGGSADTKIGDLTDLDTTYKTNVVGAINEVLGDVNQLDNYITPEMFGATGDGITNDYTAITNAMAECEITGKSLYLTKTYNIGTDRLVFDNTSYDVTNNGNGIIKYTGALAGVEFKNVVKHRYDISVISGTTEYVSGSIGLLISKSTNCIYHINDLSGFEEGVVLRTVNGGAIAHNILYLNYIKNCPSLIVLDSASSGYVNENTFFGGRLHVDSNASYSGNQIGITIKGAYLNNANMFYHISAEDCLNVVKIENGKLNTFEDFRLESSQVGMNVTSNDCDYNSLTYSWGLPTGATPLIDNTTSIGNKVLPFNNLNLVEIYNSGSIASKCHGNATNASFDGTLCGIRGSDGAVVLGYAMRITNIDTAVHCANNTDSNIGVVIDTAEQKEFYIKANYINSTIARYIAVMYDENNNELTTGAYGNINTYTHSSISGCSIWSTGGNCNNKTYYRIVVPEACKKLFLGVQNYNDLYTLSICVSNKNSISQQTVNYTGLICGNSCPNGLDSVPTINGNYIGDYCYNCGNDNTIRGWRWSGTSWDTDYLNTNAPV